MATDRGNRDDAGGGPEAGGPTQEHPHHPQFLSSEHPAAFRESKKALQFDLNISGTANPLRTRSSTSLIILQGYPTPSSASPWGPCPPLRTTSHVPVASWWLRSSPHLSVIPMCTPGAAITALGATGNGAAARARNRHLQTGQIWGTSPVSPQRGLSRGD